MLGQVNRDRAPSRGEVRARNSKLLASAAIVPVIIFLANGGVRGNGRPNALIGVTSLGALAVALAALVVALGRGRSMLGRSRGALLGLALLTPIAMFAWKWIATVPFHGMMEPWPERPGLRCLLLSSVLAAWPLLAIVMTRRGSDPVHPRLTGAALGAAVGAGAWVLVDLWCPVAHVPHLVLGHLLPLLLTTAAGVWLGRFVALRPVGPVTRATGSA